MIEEVEPRKFDWKQFVVMATIASGVLKFIADGAQAIQFFFPLKTTDTVTQTQYETRVVDHVIHDEPIQQRAHEEFHDYSVSYHGGMSVMQMSVGSTAYFYRGDGVTLKPHAGSNTEEE